MATNLFKCMLLAVALWSAGCAPGLLYTDVVRPRCTDLRGTTLGTSEVKGSAKEVRVPATGLNLSADWDSRAIGDVAKREGITKVYACDERLQSFVFGIWQKREIFIYGS